MAGIREIQSRIHSIQDTRKITNAMYMISSTKMKKARRDLEATEPYFYTLQATIDRVLRHVPQLEHRYLEKEGQVHTKIGLLVISGDKGLAGAYNQNVLKIAQRYLDDENLEIKLFVVGELGRQYFMGRHIPIEENFQYTAQNPTFDRARWITGILLEKYFGGEIDELRVIYTRMENSMQSEAEEKRILPLQRPKTAETVLPDVYNEEFTMVPSVEETVDTIVPNFIEGFIYGALVESFCSEQNDRMMAMEAATNNADQLLHDLSILYNRARQAAITQEITEVCSGARAQKKKAGKKLKKEIV